MVGSEGLVEIGEISLFILLIRATRPDLFRDVRLMLLLRLLPLARLAVENVDPLVPTDVAVEVENVTDSRSASGAK